MDTTATHQPLDQDTAAFVKATYSGRSATDSDISHSLLLLRQHWKPQEKVKAESKCLLEESADGGTVNSVKCFPTGGRCWERGRCSRTSDPSDALDGERKNVLKCIQRGECEFSPEEEEGKQCCKLHQH